jgi:hypothetical protein
MSSIFRERRFRFRARQRVFASSIFSGFLRTPAHGAASVCPSNAGRKLKRREACYTGVYLLFGEQDGDPLMYVGEGEDISERIRNHDAKKDWWTSAIFISSAANTLNKAHVKYLEARLIEEARRVGKITLENGTNNGATAPADEHQLAIGGLPLSEDRLSLREAARRMIGS